MNYTEEIEISAPVEIVLQVFEAQDRLKKLANRSTQCRKIIKWI